MTAPPVVVIVLSFFVVAVVVGSRVCKSYLHTHVFDISDLTSFHETASVSRFLPHSPFNDFLFGSYLPLRLLRNQHRRKNGMESREAIRQPRLRCKLI